MLHAPLTCRDKQRSASSRALGYASQRHVDVPVAAKSNRSYAMANLIVDNMHRNKIVRGTNNLQVACSSKSDAEERSHNSRKEAMSPSWEAARNTKERERERERERKREVGYQASA